MRLKQPLNWSEALVENAEDLVGEGYYNFPQLFHKPPSLVETLQDFTVIAEVKPASPTQGEMFTNATERIRILGEVSPALSILTEPNYFLGDVEYLRVAHETGRSILMKDIIVSEKQIAPHVSAVLLISRFLTPVQIVQLTRFAHSVDVEVLLEVDSPLKFLEAVELPVDIIGINNRNLGTMEVDTKLSEELLKMEITSRPVVSLSGFQSREDVMRINELGGAGVVVGTVLSRSNDPRGTYRGLLP